MRIDGGTAWFVIKWVLFLGILASVPFFAYYRHSWQKANKAGYVVRKRKPGEALKGLADLQGPIGNVYYIERSLSSNGGEGGNSDTSYALWSPNRNKAENSAYRRRLPNQ